MAENTTAASAQYVNTGAAATIGGKFTDQRKYDRSDKFVMQEAAYFPLTTVLLAGPNAFKKREVKDSKFITFLDNDLTLEFTPSQTSGTTTIDEDTLYFSAANARQILVGDILTVNGLYTNGSANSATFAAGYRPERVRVISKGTEGTNTPVVVTRSLSSGATAIDATMTVTKGANAQPDGYSVGYGYDVEPSDDYNYIQLISEPFAVDSVREATDAWGPDDLMRIGEKHRRSFMRQLNEAYHFGERGKANLPNTNQERRTMGGMFEYVPSGNQTVGVGTLTFEKLSELSVSHFAQGSQKKWAFCGPEAITYFSNKSDNRLVMNDKLSESMGIPQIYEFDSPNGMYYFVKDGSFYNRTLMSGAMMIYDMAYLRMVWLRNHQITLNKDVQTKREKIRQHEISGGLSLERAFANAHHLITGITG